MPRSEDPPGPVKHLRLGRISPEALESLKTFPGSKAIVLHRYGKKGEHHHWHVWLEFERPITNMTVKNRLRAHNELWKAYNSQNDWSFRNHDSWDNWSKYVMANLSAEILMAPADRDLKPTPVPIVVMSELSGAGTTAHTTSSDTIAPAPAVLSYRVQTPRSNQPMRTKFVNYLRKDLHWDDGSIDSVNYEAKKIELVDELTEYWQNAFTTPQGVQCIEHAMWVFGNPAVRAKLKAQNFLKISQILRC